MLLRLLYASYAFSLEQGDEADNAGKAAARDVVVSRLHDACPLYPMSPDHEPIRPSSNEALASSMRAATIERITPIVAYLRQHTPEERTRESALRADRYQHPAVTACRHGRGAIVLKRATA